MKGGNFSIQKYIPSPANAQLILHYFLFNNFQDFNTWQQLSKTKVDYDYLERSGRIQCRVTLKWQDRRLPGMTKKAQGSSKRGAKKRVLKRLIEQLINQGYINQGFRQQNFVEKLPRRRRSDSDDSQESQQVMQDENTVREIGNVMSLLREGKLNQFLDVFNTDHQAIQRYLQQGINFALREGKLQLVCACLRSYRQRLACQYIQTIKMKETQAVQVVKGLVADSSKQFSSVHSVKIPHQDLTDFIGCCQLQKDPSPDAELPLRTLSLNIKPLPSEQFLLNHPQPTRQTLIKHFRPIQAITMLRQPRGVMSMQQDLPCFEMKQRQFSIKLVQKLYRLVPFYSFSEEFVEKTTQVLLKQIIGIDLGRSLKAQAKQELQNYYKRLRGLLGVQFSSLLAKRVRNGKGVTLQGMLLPHKQQERLFVLNVHQPVEVVTLKLNRRNNCSQFQQLRQISLNQYILLQPKLQLDHPMIAQVVQMTPSIKLYIPSLIFSLSDPLPVTATKIYNNKTYRRTASSLSNFPLQIHKLITHHTHLIWQPPTYPILSVIVELILQWQSNKLTVLILSMQAQSLHSKLNTIGVKTIKIAPRTQQKPLTRSAVVVTTPAGALSDHLKNYAFDRVLVVQAQQIAQVMTLPAMAKDCGQLYLIGDPYLPSGHSASPYCQKNGFNISLFQRLYKQGRMPLTHTSLSQDNRQYQNVMGWCNSFIYNNHLQLIGGMHHTPIIKGFPWPSTTNRICLLDHSGDANQLADICKGICVSVVKSGYTSIEEISCSSSDMAVVMALQQRALQLISTFPLQEKKQWGTSMSRLAHMTSGSQQNRGQLSIYLAADGNTSFRELLGALSQGRRGVIIVGDTRIKGGEGWERFVGWCAKNKLICRIRKGQ